MNGCEIPNVALIVDPEDQMSHSNDQLWSVPSRAPQENPASRDDSSRSPQARFDRRGSSRCTKTHHRSCNNLKVKAHAQHTESVCVKHTTRRAVRVSRAVRVGIREGEGEASMYPYHDWQQPV